MKDLTNIYIDLSKCSEEEQRVIRMTLYKNREYVPFFTNLFEIDRYYKLHYDKGDWLCGDVWYNDKTELTYPEFIKLFEGGEGEVQVSFSMDEMVAFGKKCFYKGFDKCDTDDANCYTAWREEAGLLIEQIKH